MSLKSGPYRLLRVVQKFSQFYTTPHLFLVKNVKIAQDFPILSNSNLLKCKYKTCYFPAKDMHLRPIYEIIAR